MGERASTKKQNVRKREQQILTLANAGMHQEDIAETLGISQSTVSKTIKRCLERFVSIEVGEYRAQRVMALNAVQKPFAIRAQAGDEKAANIFLKVDERMAKYIPEAEVPQSIKQNIAADEDTLLAFAELAKLKEQAANGD